MGLSKDSVREILGDPSDVSVQKNPEHWKYGALNLSFYRGRDDAQASLVFLLLTFHTPEDKIPQELTLTDWMPSGETTLQEFKQFLTSVNLLKSAQITAGPNELVTMDSGVEVAFMDGKLSSIQLAARHKPAGRQLAVHLPEEILELIRQEAKQRRISMSALCSQWIVDHASSLSRTGSS